MKKYFLILSTCFFAPLFAYEMLILPIRPESNLSDTQIAKASDKKAIVQPKEENTAQEIESSSSVIDETITSTLYPNGIDAKGKIKFLPQQTQTQKH